MKEEQYSPLKPHEIQAAIQHHISSTSRPRRWEVFSQKPDGLYYGKAAEDGFELSLAAGGEKGNPVLEVTGWVLPVKAHGQRGCLVKLEYRPGRVNQVVGIFMLLFFLIFLLLVVLNFKSTGRLSTVIIVPVFGLLCLIFFSGVYRAEMAKSRRFFLKLLQLQKAPYTI
ncbi:hypothetical protein [Hymenobacter daeguensis]